MKRKVLSLTTLALIGALLFAGCTDSTAAGTSDVPSATTTPPATTTAAPPETDLPEVTYRPDLVWSDSYSGVSNNGDDYVPNAGVCDIRFKPTDELLAAKYTLYAVCIAHYEYDENGEDHVYQSENVDALNAYLAGRGIEEIGEAGGYQFPVYAATWDELNALDSAELQSVMEVSNSSGLDILLVCHTNKTANKRACQCPE